MKFNLNIKNNIFDELLKLRLINKRNLFILHNKTRDKKIKVLKDKYTEIIFLEKNLINKNKYKNYPDKKYLFKNYNKLILLDDDIRRYSSFKKLIKNKSILDYGCGWGGFLSLAKKIAKISDGYEIMKICQKYISKKHGIKVFSKKNELSKKKYDVIFLFHVLEHIPNHLEELKFIKGLLKTNGILIIEVPHARDLLILNKELEIFKNFTFWSEHLILHTKKSLKKFLSFSGFKKIRVNNFQRYNLDNHIKWFLNGKPGGHKNYLFKTSKLTKKNYQEFLYKNNLTDTIIATAKI